MSIRTLLFRKRILLIINFLFIIAHGWCTNIDSLKTILSNTKNKTTTYAEINYQITLGLFQEKAYDSAAIYANTAVNTFRSHKNTIHLQKALEIYSNILKNLAFNNKLIPIQQELISVCKRNKDSLALMNAYDKMGLIYYHTDITDSAIYYYEKSYKIGKLLKNNDVLINSYNNISQVYSYYGNHEKELEYCKKGLSTAIATASLVQQGTFYHNTALAFINLGQLDSAQLYVQKAIDINTRIGDTDRIGLNKTALGNIYCMQGDIEKGMEYFKEVLSYDSKVGNLHGETEGNYNLGFSYYYLKNYKLALKYTFESLRYAQKAQLKQYQADNFELISNIYRDKKDYKRALIYFDKYYHLTDSIKKNTNLALISKIQSEYEYEKNIHKIELLQKENELKEKQITSTKVIVIIASLSLIILGVILFFLYKKFKRNQELNRSLTKQYKIVQDSHSRLKDFEENTQKDLIFAQKLQIHLLNDTKLIKQFFQRTDFVNYTKNPVKNAFLWTNKLGSKLIWAIITINQQNIKGAFTSIYLFNKLDKVFHENKYTKIGLFAKSFFDESFYEPQMPQPLDKLGFCFCALDTKKSEIEFINHGMSIELIRNAKAWDFKPNVQTLPTGKLNIPITHQLQLHKKDNIVFFNENWNHQNNTISLSNPPGKALINRDALIPSNLDYSEYIQDRESNKNITEFIFLSLVFNDK